MDKLLVIFYLNKNILNQEQAVLNAIAHQKKEGAKNFLVVSYSSIHLDEGKNLVLNNESSLLNQLHGYLDNLQFSEFLFMDVSKMKDLQTEWFVNNSKKEFTLGLELREVKDRKKVEYDSGFRVTAIKDSEMNDHSYWAISGTFCFLKKHLKYFQNIESISSLIDLILSKNELYGFPFLYSNLDVESSDFQRILSTPRMPYLFLDRDGIVVEDEHYLKTIDQVKIYPEIFDIIKYFQNKGFRISIVSNQSGIARGLLQQDDFTVVKNHIDKIIEARGLKINSWNYCPYHEDGINEFKMKSVLRKPEAGMLVAVASGGRFDITMSLMVGDQPTDILKIPGLEYHLIKGKYDLQNTQAKVHGNHQELMKYLGI